MNDPSIPEETKKDVERHAAGLTSNLIEQMADKLGGHASAQAVYGTPVEREGLTLIPVARVTWGFGAGGGIGTGPEGGSTGEGGGGGGGVSATPLGFIEIRDGAAEFRPIRVQPPFWAIPPMIMASGIATSLVLRALRRLVRR